MPLFWGPFLLLFVTNYPCFGADLFSNSFLVRFRRDVDAQEAHDVATRHGFVNMGPVGDWFPKQLFSFTFLVDDFVLFFIKGLSVGGLYGYLVKERERVNVIDTQLALVLKFFRFDK